jgi:hypothetical protein
MGQECLDFRRPHFGRMSFIMMQDESTYPLDIRLPGTQALVLQANPVADAVQQLRRSGHDEEAEQGIVGGLMVTYQPESKRYFFLGPASMGRLLNS